MLDRPRVCMFVVAAAALSARPAAAAPGLTLSREVFAAGQPNTPLESGGHGPFVCRAEQRAAASLTRVEKDGQSVLTLRCPRPAVGKTGARVQVLTLRSDPDIDATRRAAFDACAARFAAFKASTGPAVFAAQARGRTVDCARADDDLGLHAFSERSIPTLAARPKFAQVGKPKLEQQGPPKLPAATLTARLSVPSTAPKPGDPTPRVHAAPDVALELELGFSPLSPPPHAGGLGGPMQPVQGFLVQVADRASAPPADDPCSGFAGPPGLLGVSDAVIHGTAAHLAGARVSLRAELPPKQVAPGLVYVRVVPYRHAQSAPYDLHPQGERRCVVTPSDWVKVEVRPAPTPIEPVKPAYEIEDIFAVALSYHPPRFWNPVDIQIDYISGKGMNVAFPEYGFTMGEGCAYNPVIPANRINASRDFIEEAADLFGQIWTSTTAWYNGAQSWIVGNIAGGLCGGNGLCKDIVGGALRTGMALGAGALGIPPELPDVRQIMDGGIDYLAASIASQVVAPGLTQAAVQAGVYAGLRESINAWSCPALGAAGVCDYRRDNPYTWGRPDPFWVRRPGMVYVTIKPKDVAAYDRITGSERDRIPRFGSITVLEKTGVFKIDRQLAPVPDVIPRQGIHIPFVLRPSGVASPNDLPSYQWLTEVFKYKGHDEWKNIERGVNRYNSAAVLEFEVVAGLVKRVERASARAGDSRGPVPPPAPRRNICEVRGM